MKLEISVKSLTCFELADLMVEISEELKRRQGEKKEVKDKIPIQDKVDKKLIRKGAWTSEEDEILKDNFGKVNEKKLANLIPEHSIMAIKQRAWSLGLKKKQKDDYLKKIEEASKIHENLKDSEERMRKSGLYRGAGD